VGDVLAALAAAFDRKGWHGPTVLRSLAGITAREASLKPAGAHHSIHQLVDHIQYWEEAGLRYATTRDKPKRTRRDWGRPTLALAESLVRMQATHLALVAAVSLLKDADLERPIGTWESGKIGLSRVLHGVAAHDAYHAGQIRLLRTLL
jgi:uncharacterized damage-inducible protein DinB